MKRSATSPVSTGMFVTGIAIFLFFICRLQIYTLFLIFQTTYVEVFGKRFLLRPSRKRRKHQEHQEQRGGASCFGFHVRWFFGINGCRVLVLSVGSHGVFVFNDIMC